MERKPVIKDGLYRGTLKLALQSGAQYKKADEGKYIPANDRDCESCKKENFDAKIFVQKKGFTTPPKAGSAPGI